MTSGYEIQLDPVRKLMTLTLSGFFDVQQVPKIADDIAAAIGRLNCPPNQHLTLVDVCDSKLQAQDTVAAFGAIIARPHLMARRLAVVVGSSLARMQVRRILLRDDAQVFDSRTEARAWLFGDSAVGGEAAPA